MVQMTEALSKRLSTVAFIATLVVVMCHSAFGFFQEAEVSAIRFFTSGCSLAAVANFFFISGFLLALHVEQEGWWKRALSKRVSTLLVPYLYWAVLGFLLICVWRSIEIYIAQGDFTATPLFRECWMAKDLGLSRIFGFGFTTSLYNFPLWYVKCLFYFILVSPPLFWLLRRSKGWGILLSIGAGLLFIGVKALHFPSVDFFDAGFSLQGFIAFIAGAMVAFYPRNFAWAERWWVGVLALLAWVLAALAFLLIPPPWKLLWWPFGTAVEVAALQILVAAMPWRVPPVLGKCSFFIYGLHVLVLSCLQSVFPWFLPFAPDIVRFFANFLVTSALCIGLCLLMRRFFPKVTAALCGGR